METNETEVQPDPSDDTEEAQLDPMSAAVPDVGFVDAHLARFVNIVRDALEWLEDGDDDTPRYLYVQSAVIANDGVPIARLRWDPESGEYEHTDLLAQDGRP